MPTVCIVRREGLLGPGIAAATAIDGTQIVCAYPGQQKQQVVWAHYPLLNESERDLLEASLSGCTPRAVAGYACVPAEKSAHRFEPIFGDYSAGSVERIKVWRATIKYYVVGG